VAVMMGPGHFIVEGGLAGQPKRLATATAIEDVMVLVIDNNEMF
jgi:CRP-like cAMP-binding protein